MIGRKTNESINETTTGKIKEDIVLHNAPARTHAKKRSTKKDALV